MSGDHSGLVFSHLFRGPCVEAGPSSVVSRVVSVTGVSKHTRVGMMAALKWASFSLWIAGTRFTRVGGKLVTPANGLCLNPMTVVRYSCSRRRLLLMLAVLS